MKKAFAKFATLAVSRHLREVCLPALTTPAGARPAVIRRQFLGHHRKHPKAQRTDMAPAIRTDVDNSPDTEA